MSSYFFCVRTSESASAWPIPASSASNPPSRRCGGACSISSRMSSSPCAPPKSATSGSCRTSRERRCRSCQEIYGKFATTRSNAPYISWQDRHLLSREVLHDPEVALFGGAHGDELIRELIEQAPPHLRLGGLLALEAGIGQAEALSDVLTQKKYDDICSRNDYSG